MLLGRATAVLLLFVSRTDCIAPFPLQKSPPAALGVAQMFQIIRFCGFRYVAACVMLCRTRIGVLLGRATAVILFFVSPYQLTAFHSLPLQKRPRAALGVAQKSTLCFILNVIHIIMHPREWVLDFKGAATFRQSNSP